MTTKRNFSTTTEAATRTPTRWDEDTAWWCDPCQAWFLYLDYDQCPDCRGDARPAAVRIAVVVDDRGDPDWHGQPVLDYWLDQQ